MAETVATRQQREAKSRADHNSTTVIHDLVLEGGGCRKGKEKKQHDNLWWLSRSSASAINVSNRRKRLHLSSIRVQTKALGTIAPHNGRDG